MLEDLDGHRRQTTCLIWCVLDHLTADMQKDTFDVLWEEGEEGEGKMMTVLLHPHIIGRAGRTKWFEEYVQTGVEADVQVPAIHHFQAGWLGLGGHA